MEELPVRIGRAGCEGVMFGRIDVALSWLGSVWMVAVVQAWLSGCCS